MKLKKLLKHMPAIEQIRIYYDGGKWINTTAKNVPQELGERKVGYIGAGYFLEKPTIVVNLKKNKKEKEENTEDKCVNRDTTYRGNMLMGKD